MTGKVAQNDAGSKSVNALLAAAMQRYHNGEIDQATFLALVDLAKEVV